MNFPKNVCIHISKYLSNAIELYYFACASDKNCALFKGDNSFGWLNKLRNEFPLNNPRFNKISLKSRFYQLKKAYLDNINKISGNTWCEGRLDTSVKRIPDRACVLFVDFVGEHEDDAWDVDKVYKYYQQNKTKFIITLKRGDCLQIQSEFGYRNHGLYFFDGKNVIHSGSQYDDYGNIPEQFTWPEFQPDYWNGIIEHNTAFPIHPKKLNFYKCDQGDQGDQKDSEINHEIDYIIESENGEKLNFISYNSKVDNIKNQTLYFVDFQYYTKDDPVVTGW